jgi:high-affinity iron transporter
MLAALVIAFREGLEAALIVGIVIGYLEKTGRPAHKRLAWAGVISAVLLSVLLAAGLTFIGAELEGPAEQLFEGTTMLLAVVVLTGMIFWMRLQARHLKSSLERELNAAAASGQRLALFGVAFLAVFREGVETALFLTASAFAANGLTTLIGALIGLGAAALVGWMLYASMVRLNLRVFFNVTSVLLLFFAAGLFAHSLHEFQEAGLLPFMSAQVWDLNPVLNEASPAGELLKALFGYNGNPALIEVVGYLAYWLVALLGGRWWVTWRSARLVPAAAAG